MKNTVLLLLGLMALGSCAQSDSLCGDLKEQGNYSKEISFDNDFFRGTKAIIENNSGLQAATLGVFANINGDNEITIASNNGYFIYNDALTYSSSQWACTQHYYWPKKQADSSVEPTVDFYAYNPKVTNFTESNGLITVPVNATGNGAAAIDVLYGSKLAQTYDKDGTADKGAADKGYCKFVMGHQLAWISFEAKATTIFEDLSITSIVVNVDNSTGNLYINTSASASATPAVGAKSAALVATSPAVPVSHTFNSITDFDESDVVYERVADFIAIPQAVSNNMTATITYTAVLNGVTYANRTTTVALNTGTLTETDCAPATWNVTNWNAGYKYVYRINFNWKEILFDVTVSGWNTTYAPYLIINDGI